ncbi:hypothetical protein MMC22_001569 [Lobaria immixta]|nr:hypothetical protein [Lobaria immixta]
MGSFDYGGTCPGYENFREKVGCCTRSRGDSGTGDHVATSSGLDLGLGDQILASGFGLGDNPVASGGIDLGTGDNQFGASGGLGLEHSNGFVPSGRLVGLGQDDEIVASNAFGPGQGDQAVNNNWLANLPPGNGPLDLRYGNWGR